MVQIISMIPSMGIRQLEDDDAPFTEINRHTHNLSYSEDKARVRLRDCLDWGQGQAIVMGFNPLISVGGQVARGLIPKELEVHSFQNVCSVDFVLYPTSQGIE